MDGMSAIPCFFVNDICKTMSVSENEIMTFAGKSKDLENTPSNKHLRLRKTDTA